MWQNLTYMYAYGPQQRYWTFEYALSYLIAPALGGFMAGNIFNQIKYAIERLEGNYPEIRVSGTTDRSASEATTKKESYHEETFRAGTL